MFWLKTYYRDIGLSLFLIVKLWYTKLVRKGGTMDRLSREEVLHVAYLARISLTEEEIEKFRVQLKVLMDDIDKIKEVKDYDDEMMYTPIEDNTRLREDVVGDMLNAKEATINAPKKNGSFIEVPVMINE